MKQYKQKQDKTIKSEFKFWVGLRPMFNFTNKPTAYRPHHAYWNYIIWFPIMPDNKIANCGMFCVTKDNIKNIIKCYEKI